MTRVFVSYGSEDDAVVRDLRQLLADHGHDGWIDSRELRGGDPLWPAIQSAIEQASAFVVVVSTDALQSRWVGKALTHAIKLRGGLGKHKFPVIPLLYSVFGGLAAVLPGRTVAGRGAGLGGCRRSAGCPSGGFSFTVVHSPCTTTGRAR